MRSSTRHEPRHLGAGMAVMGRLRPVAAPGSALVGRRRRWSDDQSALGKSQGSTCPRLADDLHGGRRLGARGAQKPPGAVAATGSKNELPPLLRATRNLHQLEDFELIKTLTSSWDANGGRVGGATSTV